MLLRSASEGLHRTPKLWEMADMVKMLEDWEAAQVA